MFTIGLARGDQRIAKNLFIGIDGNAYMAYNYVYLNIFIDIYMHMISFFWHTREQTGHPREKDNVMEKPVADSADSTIQLGVIQPTKKTGLVCNQNGPRRARFLSMDDGEILIPCWLSPPKYIKIHGSIRSAKAVIVTTTSTSAKNAETG